MKYQQRIEELNEMNMSLPGQDHYDNVEVTISPDTLIKVSWTNKEGKFSASKQFPFSAIDDVGERDRKKIEYRKAKPGEKENK